MIIPNRTAPSCLALFGALMTVPLFAVGGIPNADILQTGLVVALAVLAQRIALSGISKTSFSSFKGLSALKVFITVPILVLSFEWLRRHGASGILLLTLACTCFDIATTFLRSKGLALLSAGSSLMSHSVLAVCGLSLWGVDASGPFLVVAMALAASCSTLDFCSVASSQDPLLRRSLVVLGLLGPALICLLANAGLLVSGYFLVLLSAYPLWRVINGKELNLRYAGAMHHLIFFASIVALRVWTR